jgi:hypothetical protein
MAFRPSGGVCRRLCSIHVTGFFLQVSDAGSVARYTRLQSGTAQSSAMGYLATVPVDGCTSLQRYFKKILKKILQERNFLASFFGYIVKGTFYIFPFHKKKTGY